MTHKKKKERETTDEFCKRLEIKRGEEKKGGMEILGHANVKHSEPHSLEKQITAPEYKSIVIAEGGHNLA